MTFGTRQVPAAGSAADAAPGAEAAGGAYGVHSGRFGELTQAISEAQKQGVGDLAFLAQPIGGARPDDIEPSAAAPQETETVREDRTPGPRLLQRRNDAAIAELAMVARWARDTLENPLATFVGKNADKFNEAMKDAEQAMRAGKFYRAGDLYDLCSTMNPEDPLPFLGRGHALAAAGDFRSASWSLQQGIKRFPQIAAFRVDLVALVGQPDVLDRRRAELEKRLETDNYYELRFLLGYLELYSGLPQEGLKDLDLAAKDAPRDSTIARFPGLILGTIPTSTKDSK